MPYLLSGQEHLEHCQKLQLENHLHELKTISHEIEGQIDPDQYMRITHHITMCEVLLYCD